MFARPSIKILQHAQRRAYNTATQTFQTSQLKNGMKVVSATNPADATASVGLYINSGSRFETLETAGAAATFRRLAFRGTDTFSELLLAREFELLPATLNVAVGREQISFQTEVEAEKLAKAVALLNEIYIPTPTEYGIRLQQPQVHLDTNALHADTRSLLFEILHSEAFRGTGLGRSAYASEHRVENITDQEVAKFMEQNYQHNEAYLVATGGVDHNDLVEIAERAFANRNHAGNKSAQESKYQGGEFKLQSDANTNVGLAFEGASLQSKDYLSANLLRLVLGGGRNFRDYGLGQGHTSRLYKGLLQGNKGFSQVEAFSLSYSDAGLFGVAGEVAHGASAASAVHALVQELKNLNITEEEVAKAKQAYKAETHFSLDNRHGLAEFAVQQLQINGQTKSPEEVLSGVDGVTASALNAFAKKALATHPTLVLIGEDLENIPSPLSLHQMLTGKQ